MAILQEQKDHLLESAIPWNSSPSNASATSSDDYDNLPLSPVSPRRRIISSPWTWHTLAFIFYSLVAFALIHRGSECRRSQRAEIISSPARPAISWVRKIYEDVPDTTDFSGPPRPELDQAWHKLMSNTLIRVSSEELANANTTSIKLTGGGHPAALSVFHELHCVKKLRQALHPEYYYEGETEEELKKRKVHLDHCLEVLRHNTMCHGDFAIYGFSWEGKPEGEMKPKTLPAWHECINWDQFVSWADTRKIEDPKMEWDRKNWK